MATNKNNSSQTGSSVPPWLVGASGLLAGYAMYRFASWMRDRQYNLPPEEHSIPILGSFLGYYRDPEHYIKKTSAKLGNIWCERSAFMNGVILGDHEAQEWMVEQEKLGNLNMLMAKNSRHPVGKVLGNHHLLAIDGAEHRAARKAIFKGMSPSVIGKRVTDFARIHMMYLDKWSRQGKPVKRMSNELQKLSFRIAIEAVLGDAVDDEAQLEESYEWYLEFTGAWQAVVPFDLPFTSLRSALAARRKLDNFWLQVAEKRRLNINVESPTVLDLLLIHQNKHADDPIVSSNEWFLDQIVLIFFAAHETTSSAWTSILYFLQFHREKCEDVVNELKKNYGPEEEFDYFHSNTVLAFLKEVLRVRSVARFTAVRIASRDLKYKEYDIPKGWGIFCSAELCQQNWEDGTEFDPSRFIDAPRFVTSQPVGNPKSKYNWAPFGVGAHECVGRHVAQLQLMLFLGTLVRHFRFNIVPETVRSVVGVTMFFEFDCQFERIN